MPPGIPLTRTRVDVSANRRKDIACSATACAPRTSETSSGRATPPSERTHDVRVEDGEEAFEVAVTRRGEEGVDDGPLAIEIDVGHGRTLDPATGTARELPRRGRRPADDRGDLVERHGEDVVQHEGDPFGGRQRVEDDEHGEPDRVAQQGFLLGIDARPPGLRMGSGRWVSRDASRRVRRDRSMLRQTRPTTVVSQARRLSTSLVSVRLRRIQASWTASSASVSGAEHPKGDAAQVGAVRLEALGEPVLVVHASRSCGRSGLDG